MRAATLDVRLEELDVLKFFFRPRVSNVNAYSESLFRTIKKRPDYPGKLFTSKEQACLWGVNFFWSGITTGIATAAFKFVTPDQRHSGEVVKICKHHGRVYEQARQLHPRRWSRFTRCWRQPGVVCINSPSHPAYNETATLSVAA